MRFLLSLLLVPLWALSASAVILAEGDTYTFRVGPDTPADAISDPIQACAKNTVTWESGSATVSLYATTVADDTVSEIEMTAVLDVLSASDTFHGPFAPDKPELRLVVDSAGSGDTVVTVTCDEYDGTAGAVVVYEGNVNGVADTPNPNDEDNDLTYDDAITCADRCFFQASATYGGGWWSYAGGSWSPMNEVVVLRHRLEANEVEWNSTTWEVDACIFGADDAGSDDDATLCSDQEASIGFGRSYFLTRWSWVPTSASNDLHSCDVRIVEGSSVDSAATTTQALAASEFTIGHAAYSVNVPVYYAINATMTAGEKFIQFRNGGGGSSCVTGSSCICSTGVNGMFVLYGIPTL